MQDLYRKLLQTAYEVKWVQGLPSPAGQMVLASQPAGPMGLFASPLYLSSSEIDELMLLFAGVLKPKSKSVLFHSYPQR